MDAPTSASIAHVGQFIADPKYNLTCEDFERDKNGKSGGAYLDLNAKCYICNLFTTQRK
jgi:hypothetical protein